MPNGIKNTRLQVFISREDYQNNDAYGLVKFLCTLLNCEEDEKDELIKEAIDKDATSLLQLDVF